MVAGRVISSTNVDPMVDERVVSSKEFWRYGGWEGDLKHKC
jgi:hypothetical protein